MNNQILKTTEITTEIIHIIENTKEFCYLVSPYVRAWVHLERTLREASKKEKFVTLIARKDQNKNSSEMIRFLNSDLGFEVFLIDGLHAKLYLNEKECLITSMNLFDVSQAKNFEVGIKAGNSLQIKKDFIEDHLLIDSSVVHYRGKFHEARENKLQQIGEIRRQISSAGFCVTCGSKIELDITTNPSVLQCKGCYYKNHTANNHFRHCHFCGEDFKPHLPNFPFHVKCSETVRDFRRALKYHNA